MARRTSVSWKEFQAKLALCKMRIAPIRCAGPGGKDAPERYDRGKRSKPQKVTRGFFCEG